MAVRPKRKNPISTRPIYLPKLSAKELREAAQATAPIEGPCLRIVTDGVPAGLDVEGLAQRLDPWGELPARAAGELLSVLAGRRHGEVREAAAAIANRLGWARIREPGEQAYRVLPLRGEVDEEEARLRARSQPEYKGIRTPAATPGVLYDGAEVQAAYRELLPALDDGGAYVIVTDRNLASWDGTAWAPQTVLQGDPVLVAAAGDSTDADALAAKVRKALERSGLA